MLAAHERRAAGTDRQELAAGAVDGEHEARCGVLETSIDDLREVLDAAFMAFIVIDGGGFVLDWNGQAQRTFGWSSEEAVGRVLGELIVPPRYRAAHLEGLRRYLECGEAPMLDKRLELSAIDRSGREFPIELTITRSNSSSPPRFSALLREISQTG